MEKAKRFQGITENLNKFLNKSLQTFAESTEWSDINHWLLSVQSLLREYPSPFITEKILLTKRLNQCINPALPPKAHECVLRIHQQLFNNMRNSVDNDINEYVRLFAEDLGLYSVTILPYFTHTDVTQHRLMCLNLFNEYYLDLGMELIPMLPGLMKSILPVYGETLNEGLQCQMEKFMSNLVKRTGRKYVIGCLWSMLLKYSDCRVAGIKFLAQHIDKMDFLKDEEEYESSHGFSEEEEELRLELIREKQATMVENKVESPTPHLQMKEKQANPVPLSHITEEEIEDEGENGGKDHPPEYDSQSELEYMKEKEWESSHQIKLSRVPLVMSPGLEHVKKNMNQNMIENNFPHHNTLIVNALVVCLEDKCSLTKRLALDFMFTHLRMKSEVLDDEDRKALVEAMMRQFRRKEISITKRVNRWLLGKENEDNEYVITEKNQFVIGYIVLALKNILTEPVGCPEECTVPLKILQNFYMEHHNLIKQTLPFISLHILRYIHTQTPAYEEVFKAGQRFFENIPSYYSLVLSSLGHQYVQAIQEPSHHLCQQLIKYLNYAYVNLLKHKHDEEQLHYISLLVGKLSEGIKEYTLRQKQKKSFYKAFLRDSVLLVYNLLKRRESVKRILQKEDRKGMFFFEERVEESAYFERAEQHEESERMSKGEKMEEKEVYEQIAANLELFFVELGHVLKISPNLQTYEDLFRLATMTIVKVQAHLPKDSIPTALPLWFGTIEVGIRTSNPTISLSAISSMITCLLQQGEHPIYARYKTLLTQEKTQKYGNDYQHLALQKLWFLLSYPSMHNKIIDLILAFSRFFPYEFTQTVKKSFKTHNAAEKQASIERFSQFWRLTGWRYKDLVLVNRQFVELNKVGLFMMLDFLDDQNPLVRHAAKNWLIQSMPLFHRVLEPLFHELMSVSCDWYKTIKGILVIKNNYDTDSIFNTFRRIRSILSHGSYAFLRYIYKTTLPSSLLELREKLTDLTVSFLTQDSKQMPQSTESIMERQPVLPKALEDQPGDFDLDSQEKPLTFLDMILIIAIKYVEGQAIESMGVQFYVGNAGVNTSALELIQSLLNYIDHPGLCFRIIDYIMEPLSKVLGQTVLNKQYITQIQLLNLFQTIFFSSSFRKKGELYEVRCFFKQTFTRDDFLQSLLEGLHTPFAYVRSQFINFITICIPLIADFLDPYSCTLSVKQIIYNYYKIIKEIKITSVDDMLEDNAVVASPNFQAKINQILSVLHGVESILNYFFDFNKLTENDMKFEFTNPYTLLDTMKTILTLGLGSSHKDGKLIERKAFLHNAETCEAVLKDMGPVLETILRAWPVSEEYVRIAKQQFSSIGIKTFNFERFSRYNQTAKKLIIYVKEEGESIWGKIFSIMKPMFYRFPRQIINIYLNLWVRECTETGYEPGNDKPDYTKPLGIRSNPKNTEFLLKILQTLIISSFPTNIIIHAFLQSSQIEQISTYHHKKSKNAQTLSYQVSRLESCLLYFLYTYFNYAYVSDQSIKKDNIIDTWSFIMKSLKPFLKSSSPSTQIWILELINMCAIKYSPKEILVNQKFKTDLHGVVNDALKYIAGVASKKNTLFYEDPLQEGFGENSDESQRFRVILPIPPSLYEIFKLKQNEKNDTDKLLYRPIRIGNSIELETLYRITCFKFLKCLGFEILQNVYLSDKMHFGIKRACEWISIILPTIEEKSKGSQIFAEGASETLHNLLEKARVLFIKPLRESILKIFNKDDFFICNENTLNYWADIIDWVVSMEGDSETFGQYLNKVNLSSSYFVSESVENKRRVKSFERICFILYAGAKDKYVLKIKGLLGKIAEVLKLAENAPPALLILILFSIRILILKLSQISLNQLFTDIWPILLAFFMQIFSKKLVKVQLVNEISRNPNLLLACLKLIQLISIMNLGQFAHHEWIFIYDYFPIQYSTQSGYSDVADSFLQKRPELLWIIGQKQSTEKVGEPFHYKPYLLNTLGSYRVDYNPTKIQKSPQHLKREIIVKESFVNNDEELKVYVILLAQYFSILGELRLKIEIKELQQVIINDFINLDSFIHKL